MINFNLQIDINFILNIVSGPLPIKKYADPPLAPLSSPLSFDPVFMDVWMMRNVLKRMKNKFSNIYFSSYRENSPKIGVMSDDVTKINLTRKIKIGKIFFSFDV